MTNLLEFLDDVDTDAIEVNTGRMDPIPVGDYMLHMVQLELKPTRDCTGITLQCQYKVVEGEYEGRVIFGNFNIKNKSQQAQTIGIGQLKGLCQACGVEFNDVKHDASMLLHMPFAAKVGFGKVTDQYPDPKNEIKSFKGAAAPPASKPAPASRPAAAPASGKSLPWKKNAA